jgi:hypothetical protein
MKFEEKEENKPTISIVKNVSNALGCSPSAPPSR